MGAAPGLGPVPAPLATAAATGIPVPGGLLLRPPTEADIDAYTAACADPEIARWTELPTPYLRQHAEQHVRAAAPMRLAAGTAASFTLAGADGGVLGEFSVHDIDASRAGCVGFWIAPAARGRGLAATALAALCRWAFDEVGLRHLSWQSLVGNVASLRTAAAAGFRMEGTLRAALGNAGRAADCWAASLLPTDGAGDAELRQACGVEIAAGPWQLQPMGAADAQLAESLLPLSACVPVGVWAAREITTARTDALVALLADAHGRAWPLAVPVPPQPGAPQTPAPDPAAAAAAAAAVVGRYARSAVGLQTP